MSIESEIARINNAKKDIRLAIENKGVSVPTSEKIDTYDEYIAQIKTEKIYQEKTVTPNAIGQTVVADTGYDALARVNVTGDMNLMPSNILKDVTIFGTTGIVEPYVAPNLQSKSATPSTIGQTVVADTGYDGLSSVAIDGDFNLTADNIRKDVSIFGVTGTLDPQVQPKLQSKSVTPSASSQTVTPDTGYDGLSSVAVSGDGNLVANNIKKDVRIFGVTGTYDAGGSGSGDFNVFSQIAEPTTKKGVWIKCNKTLGDTFLSAYYTKKGSFISPDNFTFLNEITGKICGQEIVGDYLYSFGQYENTSEKYDLKLKRRVGLINFPTLWDNYNSPYGLGAYYYQPKNCIFVLWSADTSGSGSGIYCRKYYIDTDTYSETTFPVSSTYSKGQNYCVRVGDKLYLGKTRDYTGYVFDLETEETIGNFTLNPSTILVFSDGQKLYSGSSNSYDKGDGSVGYKAYINRYLISGGTLEYTYEIDTDFIVRTMYFAGSYMYLFGDNVNKYHIYNLETEELKTFESAYTYRVDYDYASTNATKVFDSKTGILYLRSKYGTFPFQFETTATEESMSNGDVLVVQSLGYNRPVEIMNNPTVQIGVGDAYIKGDTELEEHLTFWGDGEKWNLIKNPTKETITVTFNSNGGSTVPSQSVIIGQAIEKPENPTKNHYIFDNWYYNNEVFNFDRIVANDITLEARWLEAVIVTFDSDGGTTVESQSILSGATAIRPESPSKSGNIFEDWYLNGSVFDFSTPITQDITLVAHWVETEEVTITADNIGDYFTVTNDTYYFAGSGATFSSNNQNQAGTVARTTLVNKREILALDLDYSVSSESSYDGFSLNIGNNSIFYNISGEIATTHYSSNNVIPLSTTFVFTYNKDGSGDRGTDTATFSNMVLKFPKTQTE